VVKVGSLAGAHVDAPGLPRGRSSLPTKVVRAAQRERLLRAVTAAAAEKGYGAVTVADVVSRARVSRNAFYDHFDDKEACFIAATDKGRELMFEQIAEATRALPSEATAEDRLRAGLRAYLAFMASEPEFARIFNLEMFGAEPEGYGQRRAESHARFAATNRAWHEWARKKNPSWPKVPDEAYRAMVGATYELVVGYVREGRTDELPELEAPLMDLHMAVFAGAQPRLSVDI
jgi:AcrR family transcriptional regulator